MIIMIMIIIKIINCHFHCVFSDDCMELYPGDNAVQIEDLEHEMIRESREFESRHNLDVADRDPSNDNPDMNQSHPKLSASKLNAGN